MLLIWVWVNDSFRILKQLGLIVLARLEVVCQCLSILGMVLWEQERISGDRRLLEFCSPRQISLLGKPELSEFRICIHLQEASKPN